MSKRDKLRQKLRANPVDANMRDVQTLLVNFGFVLARSQGSHRVFEYDDGRRYQQIVVPLHGHKVKKVYVKRVIAILDRLFPVDEERTNEDSENDDENP